LPIVYKEAVWGSVVVEEFGAVQNGGGEGGPQGLLSKLSGMLNDPNSSAAMEDQSFSKRISSFARFQQAMMQDYQEQPVFLHSFHCP
jgi:hypothetical protein